MSTKENPGKFDCYENAKPDEEMFVLLARDALAPFLVMIWSCARKSDDGHARAFLELMLAQAQREPKEQTDDEKEKQREAVLCAQKMTHWRAINVDDEGY